MSQYVDDIVELIRSKPRSFKPKESRFGNLVGITDGTYTLTGYNNTKILSCITLGVNGNEADTTYIDRWKLESAVLWWYATCPREALEDTVKFQQRNTSGYL